MSLSLNVLCVNGVVIFFNQISSNTDNLQLSYFLCITLINTTPANDNN